MLKRLLVCFLLLAGSGFAGGTAEYNLTVPEFIPYNGNFDISLVTSNIEEDADSLLILFHSSGRLNLVSASLRTSGGTYHLTTNLTGVPGFTINLKQLQIFPGTFFQITMHLSSENTQNASLSFD